MFEINKTDIIFNTRFNYFIKKLQNELIKKWEWCFNKKYNICFDKMHDWVEEYVTNNKNLIDCVGRINTKPNLYTINICLLLDIDNYSSFKEINILELYEKELIYKIEYSNYSQEGSSEKVRCACGKKIVPKNTFHISSLKNLIKIQLGDTCIEKTGIETKILTKIKKEKIEKNKKEYEDAINNKKKLIEQFENKIEKDKKLKEELENNRKKVIEEFVNYKKCVGCKKYKVVKKDYWKIMCCVCWKKSNNINVRDNIFNVDTDKYVYLNIHFSKKDEIKDYLGKWDKDNKLWYVPKVMYTQLKKEISKIGDVIIWDNK